MCLSGQKIHKNMIDTYTSSSREGDLIGLIVDLNTGRLEFTRNGLSLGIAYENVKGPISPCISLLKGQKITLINSINQKHQLSQNPAQIQVIPISHVPSQQNQINSAQNPVSNSEGSTPQTSQVSQILQNQDFEGGDPMVMGHLLHIQNRNNRNSNPISIHQSNI